MELRDLFIPFGCDRKPSEKGHVSLPSQKSSPAELPGYQIILYSYSTLLPQISKIQI